MEFLQSLLNNTQAPFLYALLLGLLTAISPCQLATNITAIAYISKDIENKTRIFANGLFYALGNAIGYSSIGLILYFGASKFHVSKILISNGKIFIGIWLIIIGILMLDLIKIKLPTFQRLFEKIQERQTLHVHVITGCFCSADCNLRLPYYSRFNSFCQCAIC